MKNKQLLSVIVANYNNAPYLKDCLHSIICQTYKNLEIILYDDGSTDDSLIIIKHYQEKYPGMVHMISHPVNRGVSRTRHEAILQARGEYITTLDSDDYYYTLQKLEKEMELLLRYKEKTSNDIIAYSNIAAVREDKTLIGITGNRENIKEGMIFEDIITRSCMIPRDFIMKKEAYFEVGGYDFSFKTHEDWDLKIRLALEYEFYYTETIGTAYRRHGKGLSSIPYKYRTNNLWKAFKKNVILIDDRIEREIIKKRFSEFMNYRDKIESLPVEKINSEDRR